MFNTILVAGAIILGAMSNGLGLDYTTDYDRSGGCVYDSQAQPEFHPYPQYVAATDTCRLVVKAKPATSPRGHYRYLHRDYYDTHRADGRPNYHISDDPLYRQDHHDIFPAKGGN